MKFLKVGKTNFHVLLDGVEDPVMHAEPGSSLKPAPEMQGTTRSERYQLSQSSAPSSGARSRVTWYRKGKWWGTRLSEAQDSGKNVLWSSPLTFQLWLYGIGHSQLLIRSLSGQGQDAEPIGIRFEAVERMNIGRTFRGLSLQSADDALLEEIAATGYLLPRPNPLLALALRSEDAVSWVVCSKVAVGVSEFVDGQAGFSLEPVHFAARARRPD